MRNQKLQSFFRDMKRGPQSEVEILTSREEMSLLGGACPVLTSCETFKTCNPKFKDTPPTTGGGGDSEIQL